MKRLLIFLLTFVPLTMMAQDDMYFTPSKKKVQTPTQTVSRSSGYAGTRQSYFGNSGVAVVTEEPVDNSIVDYGSSKRSDDEYNRRYAGSGTGGDVYDSGHSKSGKYDTEDITDVDNNELDYRYSRRILRFHSPNVIVAVSSPYYWDLVYDCGVYDYLYDYYYYDPFYYGWAWNAGWGYGWGWGYTWRPWNSWYGPIWGWSHPRPWVTWGIGPGWAYRGYHRGWYGRAIAGRGIGRGGYVRSSRGYVGSWNRNAKMRTNTLAGSRGYANSGAQSFSRGGRGTRSSSTFGRSSQSYDNGNRMSNIRRGQSSRSTYNNNSSSRSYNYNRNSQTYNRATTPNTSRSTNYNSSRSSSSYSSGRSSSGFSGGSRGFGGGGFSGGSRGGFGGGGRASGGGRR